MESKIIALKQLLESKITEEKKYKENFISSVIKIASLKNSKKEFQNSWIWSKDLDYFKTVILDLKKINLELDAKHVTLTIRGIVFDYIAYKNRLISVYPNAIIDFDLVFDGENISFEKLNGKVNYTHKINAFNRTEDKLIGAYCIIKINGRGEFLTTLNKADLEKHRKLSNMQYLYNSWWEELYKKTILRKAMKFHFEDEFSDINEIDDVSMDNDLTNLEVEKELTEEEFRERLSLCLSKEEKTNFWRTLSEDEQKRFLPLIQKK